VKGEGSNKRKRKDRKRKIDRRGEVMAGRNSGTGTGEAGKVGRPRTVNKSQRRLVLEEGKGKKRVTFSEEEERKEDIISRKRVMGGFKKGSE